jgi:hypothetical protein
MEFANAVSMLAPLATLPFLEWRATLKSGIFALGVFLLVGNSMMYHGAASAGMPECVLVATRKLDQTAQHVSAVLFVYALSNSTLYVTCVYVYAAGSALLLWLDGRHDTVFVRRTNLFVTICAVQGSLALRGDYENCKYASFFVLAAMTCFTRGGYWHALSHLLLAPYVVCLHRAM